MQILERAQRRDQEDEFVAAQPRQHVRAAQTAAKPLRDLGQEPVPGPVAVIVIDVLEPVNVDESQCEFVCVGPDKGAHASLEKAPVGQTRQFVKIGALEQVVLALPTFTVIE